MFERLKNLLRADQRASAAALREEIGKLEAEAPASRARLEELRAKRPSVLVTGTEKERAGIRSAILAAEDEADAIDTAVAMLRTRLAEVERKERDAEINARLDRLAELRTKIVERFRTEYAPAVDRIIALCVDVRAFEESAAQLNAEARAAGIAREIESAFRAAVGPSQVARDFTREIVLVSASDSTSRVWPPNNPDSVAAVEAVRARMLKAS
jgi:hypothetical protein